jgi:hypothetical protein
MRLLCEACGKYNLVVQVSPDYQPSRKEIFRERAVLIRYIYNSEVVDEFVVSSEFADLYSLGAGDYELPDNYPDWVTKLTLICKECFDSPSKE